MSSDFVWVETPNNPADPLHDGSQEVLEFQALRPLDRIIVDVGTGDELCAWRDGQFRGSFAGHSSVDGSLNVQLFREGGWPNPPKVIPKAGAGGATVQLIPVDADTVAAWKTELELGSPNGLRMVDYSGHGYDSLLLSGPHTMPDIIPGRLTTIAYQGNQNSPPSPVQLYSSGQAAKGFTWNAHGSETAVLGDMTFLARVFQSGGQGAFPEYQYIYAHGEFTSDGRCSFAVGISANSFRPFVYWADLGAVHSSNPLFSTTMGDKLRTFQNCFLSVVRDSTAKTVRMGIDGYFETLSYSYEADAAAGFSYVGVPPFSGGVPTGQGNVGFCGGVPNLAIKHVTHTDGQIEAIRAFVMGV